MATVSVAVRITRRLKPGWDFGAMRHGEAVASAVCCGSVSSARSLFFAGVVVQNHASGTAFACPWR